MAEKDKEPMIVSVGGGKGGVGKSMVCSNIAVQYAQAGFRVILIDLDIGAANVHTIFGLRQPPKGLGEYFTTPRSLLNNYLVDTDIKNLRIIAGGGFVPELASLHHNQKIKLINHIKMLDADLVLLDLGAGTAVHVIDFFSMTQAGVVVTTPEPTSVLNAYEFLKNVIYRFLFRMFRNQPEILEILKNSATPNNNNSSLTITQLIDQVAIKNSWAAQNIRDICQDFDFYLVLNQGRSINDVQLGVKVQNLCKRFLNLNITLGGIVFHNEEVSASVFKMTPVSIAFPDSVTSQTIKRIAINIFQLIANRILEDSHSYNPDDLLLQLQKNARKDFKLNILTQRRLQRDREQREATSV